MTPEGSLLRAVCDLLTAERVWWCRQNTGSIVLGEGQSRRCFTSGRKGMADVLALPNISHHCSQCEGPFRRKNATRWSECCTAVAHDGIDICWIECKSLRGRQSPAQRDFQREVEAEGHAYLLVREVGQVVEWLRRAR